MPYGIIENGQCVNAIEADESFALSLGAIEIPEGYWIGDYYDGEWHHEKPLTEAQKIEQEITTLHLEQIAQGQFATDLQLSMMEENANV